MSDNQIHPTAIIEGDVQMGSGNVIGPYCYLRGPLDMGDDNLLTSHVVLGSAGQQTREVRYDDSECRVVIGSRNTIREFAAVQKPYYEPETRIGDEVFLMQSCHVPHDCVVEDQVGVTPMVVLGGLTRIQRGANVAISASINQFVVVGAYSIVAAGSNARANVRPFTRAIPGKPDSVNHYALRKYGFLEHTEEIEAYVHDGTAPTTEAVRQVVAAFDEAVEDRARLRAEI